MRRVLLVTVALIATSANARKALSGELSWGLKGGFVSASLSASGADAFETEADSGAAIGAFVSVDLGSTVRFQGEVILATRRFSAKNVGSPFGISSRSVEIPLLLHLKFPEGRRAQAVLFAGPQLGVISNVTQTLGAIESDISDQIKDIDVGATFGGGVEISAGRGALLLEARVSLGLRNLNETSKPRLESRALLALVGYRF